MATLQDAAVHKATADARLNYGGSIMDAIETEFIAAIAETPPRYEASFDYPVSKSRGVTQPDTSTIDCDLLVYMLKVKGYSVSSPVEYGTLKLHLKIE